MIIQVIITHKKLVYIQLLEKKKKLPTLIIIIKIKKESCCCVYVFLLKLKNSLRSMSAAVPGARLPAMTRLSMSLMCSGMPGCLWNLRSSCQLMWLHSHCFCWDRRFASNSPTDWGREGGREGEGEKENDSLDDEWLACTGKDEIIIAQKSSHLIVSDIPALCPRDFQCRHYRVLMPSSPAHHDTQHTYSHSSIL